MIWEAVFGVFYLVAGGAMAIFARPIAVWDYKLDKKWKLFLQFGLKFRIWFLRIGGIIMILMGLFVLAVHLMFG